MESREWSHQGLTRLVVVEDMHQRKQMMLSSANALVALPGGCGTLEELLEAITWKRLGLHNLPVLIVNQNGFYDGILNQLHRCTEERLLDLTRGSLWTVVGTVFEAVDTLHSELA